MALKLASSSYGKSRVRLVKVERHPDRHDLIDLTVNIRFTGDYDASYSAGDNSRILPTDTMKNTVYALAAKEPARPIEKFGQRLVHHFLQGNSHLSEVRINISEQSWARMHPHAFRQSGSERRTAEITATHDVTSVRSGIENLVVLKTTDSAFEGYLRDSFTTLPETGDRILATAMMATWKYAGAEIDFDASWNGIRKCVLEIFAAHHSRSVQHTLHAMGEGVLRDFPAVDEIAFSLPNKHCLAIDLRPFGLENRNEIFLPVDEPHGLIEATLRRQ